MIAKRLSELQQLNNDFTKPTSSFIFLFGQKQVGKTTFLYEYVNTKEHLHFSCLEVLPKLLFSSFSQQIIALYNLNQTPSETFDDFLTLLGSISFEKKMVVIFDDFHTIFKIQKETSILFMKHWNGSLKYKNIQIIFSSSLYFNPKEESLLYKSASEIIFLNALNYDVIQEVLPTISKTDALKFYALFGTTMKYLLEYDVSKEFAINLKNIFLKHKSQIQNEGLHRIKEELSETSTYVSILCAISKGNHKIGEIAQFLGVKSSYLTRYIQKLMDMMMIKKLVPINEDVANSKFGRYVFEDNYMKFWFGYVYFNSLLLNDNGINNFLHRVLNELDKSLLEEAFKMRMTALITQNFEQFFGYTPLEVGSWWSNKEKHIDVVGYDLSTITFVEIQYNASKNIKQMYEELQEKSNSFESVLNKKFAILTNH
jgi:AAA+ ATPase superfamily predicted ATPase